MDEFRKEIPPELRKLLIALTQAQKDGKPIGDSERVAAFRKLVETGLLPTFAVLLPLVLNLHGHPYTLTNHYPFESVFRTRLPRRLLLKTARQVSKSTSIAARALLLATSIPHFSVLFVTPLYEQIRRFSTNYVRRFIEESPIKAMWCGSGTENSVLQRSFVNRSQMYFSFALTDADRTRGIAADANCFDEIQDMDANLIPIVEETMSGPKSMRLVMYCGTPKTMDNTIEGKWTSSSQAEWAVPCANCKKLNIPRMGYDLEKMIGPWHPGIGPLNPTPEQIAKKVKPGVPAVVCANCEHWIDPRNGFWVHKKPELRWKFPGYHVPQIIMPFHYESRERWGDLLAKREGYGNCTVAQFYNEVLGESYDTGSKLVTKTDLEEASILPWANEPLYPVEPLKHRREYVVRVLGVDWGGGGEEEVSFTTMAVVGLRADGKLDCLYGRRLLTPHDHMGEAMEVMRTFNAFDCAYFAHDYCGAGSLRETFMVQAGMPLGRIVPFVYVRSAHQDPIKYHKSESGHSRNYWTLDKTRSLQTTCQCIKLKQLRFFKHDYVSEENRGLQHDFLALMENKVEMPRGPDAYMIQRNPHFPDDFAHAVNYACSSIWHHTQKWPNLAQIAGLTLSQQQLNLMTPRRPHWDGEGFFGQP